MKKIEKAFKMVINLTVGVSFFISCSKPCSPLEMRLKEICNQPDTLYRIQLNSLADFEWNELYILSGPSFPEEVEEVIGINYDKIIKDHHRQFIFVKDKKIVKEYSSSCGNIDISVRNKNGYTQYSDSAIVYIETKLNTGNVLYLHAIPLSEKYE